MRPLLLFLLVIVSVIIIVVLSVHFSSSGNDEMTPTVADAIMKEAFISTGQDTQKHEIPLSCSKNTTKFSLENLDNESEKTTIFKTFPCVGGDDDGGGGGAEIKCNVTFENMTPIKTRNLTVTNGSASTTEQEIGLLPCRINGTIGINFLISSESKKVKNISILYFDVKIYNVKGGCCPSGQQGRGQRRRRNLAAAELGWKAYGYYDILKTEYDVTNYVYETVNRKVEESILYDEIHSDRPQYSAPLNTPDCSSSFFCQPDAETIEWRKKAWRIN